MCVPTLTKIFQPVTRNTLNFLFGLTSTQKPADFDLHCFLNRMNLDFSTHIGLLHCIRINVVFYFSPNSRMSEYRKWKACYVVLE